MAGSPLKRARKAGVTDPGTGALVPFPYTPRVTELPSGWRRWSPADGLADNNRHLSIFAECECDDRAGRFQAYLQRPIGRVT